MGTCPATKAEINTARCHWEPHCSYPVLSDSLDQWLVIEFILTKKKNSISPRQPVTLQCNFFTSLFWFLTSIISTHSCTLREIFLTHNFIQQENTICTSEVRLGNTYESGKQKSSLCNSSNQSVWCCLIPHLFMLIFFSSSKISPDWEESNSSLLCETAIPKA